MMWRFGLLAIGVLVFMSSSTRAPLNVRNNNPLNIRDTGTAWNGKTGESGGFVKFESVEYGFRAAARILRTYRGRGVYTLENILNTWAPKGGDSDDDGIADYENPTQNYINFVSGRTGIHAHDIVDESQYPALMLAMSLFEGANEFTIEQAETGAQMA